MRDKTSQEYISATQKTHEEKGYTLLEIAFHPKAIFLTAAFLSLLLSVYLWFVLEDQMMGIFVGIWVPSILSAGNLVLTPTPDKKRDKPHE